MSDENSRIDSAVSHINRRRVLGGMAGLVTAGGTVVAVADPAAAQVSVESFAVPDASLTGERVTPVVDLELSYSYDAGNAPVAGLVFELSVGDTVVASDELTTNTVALEGSTTLSGTITESDQWAASDFAPDVAASVTRDVSVSVSFAVVDSSGSVIVEDTATDTAAVTVSHPQETKLVAEVGGSGVIRTATE